MHTFQKSHLPAWVILKQLLGLPEAVARLHQITLQHHGEEVVTRLRV